MARYATKKIEQVVRGDPHVVAIRPGGEWDLPAISPELWTPQFREMNKNSTAGLADFLTRPLIEDDFGQDNDARGRWRLEMQEKDARFTELWEQNALPYSTLFGVVCNLANLAEGYVGLNPDDFEAARTQVTAAVPERIPYHEMGSEDKIESVNALKQEVFQFLKFLSRQRPADD